MTLRDIDRPDFEADCRQARERAFEAIAERRRAYAAWLASLKDEAPAKQFNVQRRPKPRDARPISYNGKSLTAAEWASHIGVSAGAIQWRLRNGWPLDRALAPQDMRGDGRHPGVSADFGGVSPTEPRPNAQDFSQLEISE